MSSLIVEVCQVDEVKDHPNADRLDLVRVKGWWTVSRKDSYKVGDKCVYVPPDSILPKELAERWGIANYCSILGKLPNGERPEGLRVRASRLRGERSFGTIQPLDDPSWAIGHDLKDYYGITKYEPPVKCIDGDAASPHPAFQAYTSIENICNFPDIFKKGEEVVFEEKVHGSNSRLGIVVVSNETTGEPEWETMAGSHGVCRKMCNAKGKFSLYWKPVNSKMLELLHYIRDKHNATSSVMVYGELFGAGIQDMQYGRNDVDYLAYDIAVDGEFLDYDERTIVFNKFDVKRAPFLYRGNFSLEIVEEYVDGPTKLAEPEEIREPFKGREGIVIRPVQEYKNFDLGGSGRAILKAISVDYHQRKNKNQTEGH